MDWRALGSGKDHADRQIRFHHEDLYPERLADSLKDFTARFALTDEVCGLDKLHGTYRPLIGRPPPSQGDLITQKETFMPDRAPMSMKMGHGTNAFSNTSIACMRDCIDMREAKFHIKTGFEYSEQSQDD